MAAAVFKYVLNPATLRRSVRQKQIPSSGFHLVFSHVHHFTPGLSNFPQLLVRRKLAIIIGSPLVAVPECPNRDISLIHLHKFSWEYDWSISILFSLISIDGYILAKLFFSLRASKPQQIIFNWGVDEILRTLNLILGQIQGSLT